MRTMIAPNKNGPRKLKSYPFFAAQKVQKVKESTTTVVRIADSRITFPVPTNKVTVATTLFYISDFFFLLFSRKKILCYLVFLNVLLSNGKVRKRHLRYVLETSFIFLVISVLFKQSHVKGKKRTKEQSVSQVKNVFTTCECT